MANKKVKRKIKKGDLVIVLAGKDKGRQGTVMRVCSNDRVYVEGVNMIKKHTRPNPQQNVQGGIVEKEAAIHISNIAHYDAANKKPSRVGYRFLEDGKKVRYLKTNNEVVDI